MHLDSVQTPALVIDGDRLQQNIDEMAARADRAEVELWPHVKTHKSVEIARMQHAAGAIGMTAATLGEAERLVAAGFDQVILAHPPVGRERIGRAVSLGAQCDLRVALDDAATWRALDDACVRADVEIGVLWEIDSGLGRLGTPPGRQTVEVVASVVDRLRRCRFDGLFTFAGHAYRAGSADEIRSIAQSERSALRDTAAAFEDDEIDVEILSAGSTPTAHHMEDAPGAVDQMRPGNYVFYDATQVALGVATSEQCALSVLGTVVSRPRPDRLILDSGSKAMAAERMTELRPGFGLVLGHPDIVVERLFEEHAILSCPAECTVAPGDQLRLVPNHACAAVNLHSTALVVDASGEVLDRWEIAPRSWTAAAH